MFKSPTPITVHVEPEALSAVTDLTVDTREIAELLLSTTDYRVFYMPRVAGVTPIVSYLYVSDGKTSSSLVALPMCRGSTTSTTPSSRHENLAQLLQCHSMILMHQKTQQRLLLLPSSTCNPRLLLVRVICRAFTRVSPSTTTSMPIDH